jgi:tetratricopeptide (TPR) repeat protein
MNQSNRIQFVPLISKYFIIILTFFLAIALNATPNDDLLDAASKGDLPKLEVLLGTGKSGNPSVSTADINYADSENRTALYFAYKEENTDIVTYLKKNGAKETSLTKLFQIGSICLKELEKRNFKGVLEEADSTLKEKIQYAELFQKKDNTLSLEQEYFISIYYLRSLAYMVLDEYKLAIVDYEFILQKNKTMDVTVYTYYARALHETGDIKKEIQVLESGLPFYEKKDKAHIYFNLGWSYYHDNQIDKAIFCSEETFKLAGTDLNFLGAYFNNSIYKFQKGDYESGWNWFFYSLNLVFQMEPEARKKRLLPTVSDFEDLLKKQKEPKSKTLTSNVITALWFLHKIKEDSISEKLTRVKELRISKIEKSLSEKPFETSINPELIKLLTTYSSKIKNSSVIDKDIE